MEVTAAQMKERTNIVIKDEEERLKKKYQEIIHGIDKLITKSADDGRFYIVLTVPYCKNDYIKRHYKEKGFIIDVISYDQPFTSSGQQKIKISWE